MLLQETGGRCTRNRYAKGKSPRTRAFPSNSLPGRVLQKPVQVGETPPSVLPPRVRKRVLTTLDSPSVQLRPHPVFPVTVLFGAARKSPDPKTSRMPSPGLRPTGRLPWIVLDMSWAADLSERTRPKPTLLLMTASRMESEESMKAKIPPCEAGLPFPVIVLTVVKPKFASPMMAELRVRLIPVPALPEIVFPPTMSALALARLIPMRRFPGAALVPLPVIWFIPMTAPEPNMMWMPFEALALITLPAAALALSTPMRAELLVNSPTPILPF